jgi:hypothetical protein
MSHSGYKQTALPTELPPLYGVMKNIKHEINELEAELLQLNSLVRERRKELVRLAKCPNKSCTCRLFWQKHVEKLLALQMRKIRREIRSGPRATAATGKGKTRKPVKRNR